MIDSIRFLTTRWCNLLPTASAPCESKHIAKMTPCTVCIKMLEADQKHSIMTESKEAFAGTPGKTGKVCSLNAAKR